MTNSIKLKNDKDYKDDLVIFPKGVEAEPEDKKKEEGDLDLNVVINKDDKTVLSEAATRNVLFKKKK